MNIDSAQSNFLADQTRRAFLGRAGGGFGGLALGCLLRENLASNPLKPHFAPRAKRVISLFMSGGRRMWTHLTQNRCLPNSTASRCRRT